MIVKREEDGEKERGGQERGTGGEREGQRGWMGGGGIERWIGVGDGKGIDKKGGRGGEIEDGKGGEGEQLSN